MEKRQESLLGLYSKTHYGHVHNLRRGESLRAQEIGRKLERGIFGFAPKFFCCICLHKTVIFDDLKNQNGPSQKITVNSYGFSFCSKILLFYFLT